MGHQDERTSSAEARAEGEATDEIWGRGEERRDLCVCVCVYLCIEENGCIAMSELIRNK